MVEADTLRRWGHNAEALPLYFAATLSLLAAYTFYRLQHVCDLVSEPAALSQILLDIQRRA